MDATLFVATYIFMAWIIGTGVIWLVLILLDKLKHRREMREHQKTAHPHDCPSTLTKHT